MSSDLIERDRMLRAGFAGIRIEVVDRTELPGTLAVVRPQRGRYVGPRPTALGPIEPTGRTFDVLGIDVLTISDGRIGCIWVVADELGWPTQLGAVTLASPAAPDDRDAPDA